MKNCVNYELAEKRRQFKEFYDEKLRGDYQELEEKRKPYLRSFWLRVISFLAFIGVSVYSGFLAYVTENDSDTLMAFWIITLFVLGAYAWAPVDNYKTDTKKLVMNKILSFWGNLTYHAVLDTTHSIEVLKQSQLFDNLIRQDYDDCFWGSYHGVEISVSEQKLYEMSNSGKNDICVFQGILISLDMAKKFSGHTVVCKKDRSDIAFLRGLVIWFLILFLVLSLALSKEAVFNLNLIDTVFAVGYSLLFPLLTVLVIGGMGSILWRLLRKRKNLQDVSLEDVVFDKHWQVESTDQIEARYVLTPAFMERMLEVKRRFKGRKIEFSFWDNKMLIAVHTHKDMFETTSLFTPALDYRKVQEVVAQFYSVFSVADVLLGLKQEKK